MNKQFKKNTLMICPISSSQRRRGSIHNHENTDYMQVDSRLRGNDGPILKNKYNKNTKYNIIKLLITLLSINIAYAAEIRDPTQPIASHTQYNASGLKLSAVIISKNKKIAVINGDIKKEGDAINSGKIVSIHPNHVLILDRGKEIILPLITEKINEKE